MKSKKNGSREIHPIEPIFSKNSEILILGSFPSVQSRADCFYYAHPQNRFWRTLSEVLGEPLPQSKEEKTALLLAHRIALWDVIASCDIHGSSDSSISSVIPNDLSRILSVAPIRRIYVNGRTAEKYYMKYLYPITQIRPLALPSTSAANAAWSQERLTACWREIKQTDP